MKIPNIKSSKKIRDVKICILYLEGGTQGEIAIRFHLSQAQISRILWKQRDVLRYDKDYERTKRIVWLKQQIIKRQDSKKDSADLVSQLRDEIEEIRPAHTGIHIHKEKVYVFRDVDPEEIERNNRASGLYAYKSAESPDAAKEIQSP